MPGPLPVAANLRHVARRERRLWSLLGVAVLAMGVVLFAAHVAGIASVFAEYGHVPFEDWWNASNAADRLLTGKPLYHAEQLEGPYFGPAYTLSGLAYPPPAAVLFVPFRGAPFGLALWLSANVGLLATGLLAILRNELGAAANRAMPFVVGGLLAFPPFAVGVMWANLNVGLAGLFAWSWVERSRWTAAGAGLGALLKLYPAAVAVWRTRTDGFVRPILTAAVVAAGISAVTLPIVGLDAWTDFATAFTNTRPVCTTEMSSVVCLLDGPLGFPGARVATSVLALILVFASSFVPNKSWAYAIVMAGMMFAVLDVHFHYWIFAYVAVTAIVSKAIGRKPHEPGPEEVGSRRRRGSCARDGEAVVE